MRAECTREKTGEALSVKIVDYGTLIYIKHNLTMTSNWV